MLYFDIELSSFVKPLSLDGSPGLRIGVVILVGLGKIILLGTSGGLPTGLILIELSLFYGVCPNYTDFEADEQMSMLLKESRMS